MTTPASTPTVRVEVGAALVLSGSAPADALRAVDRALAIPNPEWSKRAASGRWLGTVEPELRFARRLPTGDVEVPRGAFHLVRRVLAERGLALDVVSRATFAPPAGGAPWLPVDAPAGFAPRPYQLDAEERMLRGVQGYVVLPCGGGKTQVASRALVRSGQAGLVLCHTEDLVDQWAAALWRASADPPRLVGGSFGADFRGARPGRLVVALVQTVATDLARAAPLLRSVGAIVVDEAHRCPGRTYADVLHACPARYRWGLTATPDRPDGLGPLLDLYVGPPLYRRTARELADDGWLVLPRVAFLRSGWSAGVTVRDRTGRLDWAKAVAALSDDPTRTTLIVDLAAAAVADGRQTLVLVHRKANATRLAMLLRARGVQAEAVTGDVERRHRRRRVSGLRSGRVECLVATQLADEGLDLPDLGCLVVAAPQKAEGRALQRLGRLTRPKGSSMIPVCFDLVDGGLEHQARARSAAYAREYAVAPEKADGVDGARAVLRRLAAEAGTTASLVG